MSENRLDGKYVVSDSGCWLWSAGKSKNGYGMLWDPVARTMVYAHRESYRMHKGSPGSLHVRHTCDTPACVNPDHLLAGTPQQNIGDMVARGRHVTQRGEASHFNKHPKELVLAVRKARHDGLKYR